MVIRQSVSLLRGGHYMKFARFIAIAVTLSTLLLSSCSPSVTTKIERVFLHRKTAWDSDVVFYVVAETLTSKQNGTNPQYSVSITVDNSTFTSDSRILSGPKTLYQVIIPNTSNVASPSDTLHKMWAEINAEITSKQTTAQENYERFQYDSALKAWDMLRGTYRPTYDEIQWAEAESQRLKREMDNPKIDYDSICRKYVTVTILEYKPTPTPTVSTIPKITIITPNGGEVLRIGDTVDIKWQTTWDGLITIELSRDGCNNWQPIASHINNTGTYSWVISGDPSTQCRISIKPICTTVDGFSSGPISQHDFTISAN